MLLNERKDALAELKKDLSLDFLQVDEKLPRVVQKIENFSSAHDHRIKDSPERTRGHKFFFDLMTVDSSKIIEALDQELKALDDRLMMIESEWQAKVDTVL